MKPVNPTLIFANAVLRPSFAVCMSLAAIACTAANGAPTPPEAPNAAAPLANDDAGWSNPGCTEAANVVDTGLEVSLRVDLANWQSRTYAVHERIVVRPTKAGSAVTLFGTALVLGTASHGYAYDGKSATFCTGSFAPGDPVTVDVDYVVSEKIQSFPEGNVAGIHVWQEGGGPAVVGSYTSPFFASTWMFAPETMPWVDAAHAGNVSVGKVTLDVVVPADSWTVVGPGDAQKEGSVWRFAIDRAMPLYAVAFAASPSFVHVAGGATKSGVALSSAVFPGDRDVATKRMGTMARTIEWMEQTVGGFPWSEPLTFAEIPGFPGGMEHTAGIWIGSPVLGSKDGDYVAVHETLHHWWGDDVRVADWPHFWLSEGLVEWTTVFAAMEAIAPEGNGALQKRYRDEAAEMSYGASSSSSTVPAGPLRFPDGGDFAAQVQNNLLYFYRYGAAFLEMLDQRLRRGGKQELGAALKEWFARKSGKTVTTEEFRDFLGEWTGDSAAMKALFAEWVERGPAPTLELGGWSYAGGTAKLSLRRAGGADQTLDQVEVTVASGATLTTKVVAVPKGNGTTNVAINVPSAPTAVAIDAHGLYILRLRTATGWSGPAVGNTVP